MHVICVLVHACICVHVCACGVQKGYMFCSLLPVEPSDFIYRKDLDMSISLSLCIVELKTTFQMFFESHFAYG